MFAILLIPQQQQQQQQCKKTGIRVNNNRIYNFCKIKCVL